MRFNPRAVVEGEGEDGTQVLHINRPVKTSVLKKVVLQLVEDDEYSTASDDPKPDEPKFVSGRKSRSRTSRKHSPSKRSKEISNPNVGEPLANQLSQLNADASSASLVGDIQNLKLTPACSALWWRRPLPRC
jgi:hypothetical protein